MNGKKNLGIRKSLNQIINRLLLMFCFHETIKKKQAYISKYNFNRENKVILLMINDGKNGTT